MYPALHYIFKKNVSVIIILSLLFFAAKCLTIYTLMGDKSNQRMLNEWVKQCEDLKENELEGFTSALGTKLEEDAINDFSLFVSSFQNVKSVNRLIDFAKNKEGVLPTALPANYMKLLEFYSELERPQIINRAILDDYFELQKYSTVILIATMVTAIFWGQHYELEIYRYVATTPKGKKYDQTIRKALFFISCFFLLINELIDLFFSEILHNLQTLKASIQSYSAFCHAQNNTSILMCFGIMFIGKVITVFCVCTCFELIARKKKNMKDTLLNCICVLLMIFFIKQGMTNTGYFSVVQIGVVDWKETIAKSIQMIGIHVSTLELGFYLNCLTGIMFGMLHYVKIHRS